VVFAAQLELDNVVGHTQNPGLQCLRSKRGSGPNYAEKSLTSALQCQAINNTSQYNPIRRIVLYPLRWGKASRSNSWPSASALFPNALTTTALLISRTALIPSRRTIPLHGHQAFIASFVIRAVSLLMASSCWCDPAVWNYSLQSDVWRPGHEQVAQVSRSVNFHDQLPDHAFSNTPGSAFSPFSYFRLQ
jgi:hypothetical protein